MNAKLTSSQATILNNLNTTVEAGVWVSVAQTADVKALIDLGLVYIKNSNTKMFYLRLAGK